MTDVIITRDCDGHTQRVILKNTPEGVRFWIEGRKRSSRLVKGATIAQVKSRLKIMGGF
jgi:hypothetical protein